MWKPMIAILAFVSVLAMPGNGQEYRYEHKLRPKESPKSSFGEFADETNTAFFEANREAGNPRILILFDEQPIQNMGGFSLSDLREIELKRKGEISTEETGTLDVENATASLTAQGTTTGTAKGRSSSLLTFRDYVPTNATDWSPKKVGGFDRLLLENALVAPLVDAGAVIVDRKTALDFHADDIFSAMKRDRLESQREALKKVADLILTIHVSRATERITKVSGDVEVPIPTLSARILSIGDARLLDVISNRAVSRVVDVYDADSTDIEVRAEVLAYVVMDRLTHYWNREK
ncbi:MAG: hypothetical protein ABIH23_18285 [bacterium]